MEAWVIAMFKAIYGTWELQNPPMTGPSQAGQPFDHEPLRKISVCILKPGNDPFPFLAKWPSIHLVEKDQFRNSKRMQGPPKAMGPGFHLYRDPIAKFNCQINAKGTRETKLLKKRK